MLNVLSVDIQNVYSDFDVKLYPNPTLGQFTLEFSDDVARDIEITNALGKLITKTTVSSMSKYNMDDAAAGVYFLTIKEDDRSRTLRFSLQDKW